MYYNEDYPSDIVALVKQGTNSTMFTNCCNTAINDDETHCPHCKRPVVGWDEPNRHERHKIRWKNATRFWDK